MTSTALSLISVFAEEANHLHRRDQASRLRLLCSSIKHQLLQAERNEDMARYARHRADLVFSLGGLALGSIIRKIWKDKQPSTLAMHLLENPARKEHPFGKVLVCIGPKGMPDEVEAISISSLARESEWDESHIISELEQQGYLLLSERAFRQLIDRLIASVLEGQLHLPVSLEKLSRLKITGNVEPEAHN
jgi:hypothetical protein